MNYNDIKDCIIRTTNTLDLVPLELVPELLGSMWDTSYLVDLWTLRDREHSPI